MRKPPRVGEPYRGRSGPPRRSQRREKSDLGIGGRKEDDVAGRLIEIDRDVAIVDPRNIGGSEVHQW